MAATTAAALPEPQVICAYTYAQYINGRNWGYATEPWRHDDVSAEAQRAWTERFWAGQPENYRRPLHEQASVVLRMSDPCVALILRWVEEALAYGDIVVPVVRAPAITPEAFFVTHVGTPPERVEQLIRSDFAHSPEVAERVVSDYRSLMPEEIATSIASIRAALPVLSYEAWLAGTDRYGKVVYWDHDGPLATRIARTLAYAEAVIVDLDARAGGERRAEDPYFGLGRPYGERMYAFVDLPSGRPFDRDEAYRARWLTEAIEGGDLVVPYVRPAAHYLGPAGIRFAVFAAGLPFKAVEHQIRFHLRWWERFDDEAIEAVVANARTLAGGP